MQFNLYSVLEPSGYVNGTSNEGCYPENHHQISLCDIDCLEAVESYTLRNYVSVCFRFYLNMVVKDTQKNLWDEISDPPVFLLLRTYLNVS